ncbi:unnamed protein product [Absidia cylindrospora]
MTTRNNKKQRLLHNCTTSTIHLNEQQQHLQANDDNPRRRQIKKIIVYYESDSCNGDQREANDLEDFEYSKRDIHEILDYTSNTIEHQPDGSVIITPHLRQFPTEIIASIAHHLVDQADLYRCTLVNQQFYAVVNPMLWRAPYLWNKPSLQRFLTCLVDAEQPCIVRQRIRKLEVSGTHWTDLHLSMLIPYLRCLEDFTMDNNYDTEITNTSLEMLPRHCPNLRSFSVHCFHRLGTSMLETLSQHAHQLRAFTFYHSNRSPVTALDQLAKCPLLEDLTIYSTNWRQFPMIKLKKMHRLTHLTIRSDKDDYLDDYSDDGVDDDDDDDSDDDGDNDSDDDDGDKRLSGVALFNFNNSYDTVTDGHASLSLHWPHLTHFSFHNGTRSTTLDDVQLIRFLQSHPQLQYLKLVGGDYTDHALDVMTTTSLVPLVSSLHLRNNFNITPNGARRLIQNWPQLTSLTFDICFRIQRSHFPESSYKDRHCVKLDRKAMDNVRQATQG